MRGQLLSKTVNVYNYSGAYVGYYFRLYVYLNSQDTTNNTSNITVTMYGKANTSTGGGYSGFSSPSAKVRVGGEDKNSRSGVNIPTSGTEVSMATWTGNVSHNNDGTLSLSVSGVYAPNTSSYSYLPQATTISDTITLPTIARASTVTVPATLIQSSSGNVTATITSKADYWHKWRRYIVGTTVPSWNTKGEINNTSSTVTVSYSDILNAMPSDWQGRLHIDVATYSSSSYSTQIGDTQWAEADITIDRSSIKPSFSIGTITYNSNPSGAPGYIIAGYSKVSATINSITQGTGATTSKDIKVDFYKGSSRLYTLLDTITANSKTAVSTVMPASSTTYTIKVKVTVTDSRGAYTTAESNDVNVYGYDKPTLNFTAYRVASSGSETYDGAGGQVYLLVTGTVNGSVPSNAIQTYTCKQDSSSGTAISLNSSTHKAWFTLDTTRSKTFYGRVKDKISTSENTIFIPVASYPLDLYDNGSGTVGVGLGTIATSGYVTIGQTLHTKGNWFTINNLVASNLNQTGEGVVAYNTSTTNRPCDYGVCYTLGQAGNTNSSSWYSQIAFGTNGITYFRNSINSQGATWGAWYPIYAGNNKPTASDVGALPISSSNTADGEYKFMNSSYAPTISNTAPGIGCANKGSRYLVNELLTDGIIAPPTAYTQHNMNTTASTIRFYKYTGYSSGQWTGLTKTAEIDTNGFYRPKVSTSCTISLTGISAYANSTTVLRFKVPIPPGYSSATLSSSTVPSTAGAGSTSWTTTGGTIALMTGTNDQNFEVGYLNMTLTMSSATFTASRGCVFQNGSVTLTLS